MALLGVFVVWFARTMKRKRRKIKRLKELTKSFERLPEVELRYDEAGFVEFCYNIMSRKKRIKAAEEAFVEAEAKADVALANLQNNCNCDAAEQWKEARKDEMLKRATLNSLRNGKGMDEFIKAEFLADFAQVKSMRGVKQVYLEDGKLHVMVRVAYPYERWLYDAGDFMVIFYRDKSFAVTPIRAEWVPYTVCNVGGEVFCFGDERQEEINSYLHNGRVVEAIELIIDALYYVDNHDYMRIPSKLKPIRALTREEIRECRKRKSH